MAVYNRYKKYRKAIKYADNSIVFINPAIYKKGELISQSSFETLEDCLYDPMYRWYTLELNEDISASYICENGKIYYKEVYQISKDGGLTWNDVIPEQYRKGKFYKEVGSCIDLPCKYFSMYNTTKNEDSSNFVTISYYTKISTDWYVHNIGQATPPFDSYEVVNYFIKQGWINIEMSKANVIIRFNMANDSRCDIRKIVVPCLDENVKQIILELPSNDNDITVDLTQVSNHPFQSLNNFITLSDLSDKKNGNVIVDCQQLKNLTNVVSMCSMFYSVPIKNINLSNLNTDNNLSLEGLFMFCKKLETVNLTNLNTSKVTDMNSMFMGCENLTNIDISTLDFKNVTDIGNMFNDCSKLTNIIGLDKLCSESKPSVIADMFARCKNLTEISIEGIDLINLKHNTTISNTSNMFARCENLKKINLSNCKNANGCEFNGGVFDGDTKLEEINFSNSQFNLCQFNVFQGLESLKTVNVSGCPSKFINDVESAISWAGLDNQVTIIK